MDEEKKNKLLPKNWFLYGIALMWSFFIVFIYIYVLVHRNQSKLAEQLGEGQFETPVDSTLNVDSTLVESSNIPIEDLNPEDHEVKRDILTVDDELKILRMENGRRKRENDYLWQEFRTLGLKLDSVKTFQIKIDRAEARRAKMASADSVLALQNAGKKKITQVNEKDITDKVAITKSAKFYSSMKPERAASILSQFDDAIAADILLKMRDRQVGKVLEAMTAKQAARICKTMIFKKQEKE